MAISYTFDVTSSAPSGGISLKRLGIRQNIPKWSDAPTNTILTTGYDLSAQGLSTVDIQESEDLTFALDNNYIVLYRDAIPIDTPTSINLIDLPQLTEVYDQTKEPTGIINRAQSTVQFVDGTRTLSLSPTGVSFDYYIHGVKYTVASTLSTVLPDVTALYMVFLDNTGNLDHQVGFDVSLLKDKGFVASVYWNATTGKCEFLVEERHGITMDWASHIHLHNSFGTRYYSGFGISHSGLVGSGVLDNEAQISLSGGVIADEDLIHQVVDAPTPSNIFEQTLSSIAKIPVVYKLGSGIGEWRKDIATDFPIKIVSGQAQYNSNSGSWALSNVADGNFVAMWLVILPTYTEPVISIMGSREDTTLDNAKNHNGYSSVDFSDIPSNEIKALYRLIFQCNTSYANAPKVTLRDVLDIRHGIDQNLISSVPTPTIKHGDLTSLSADDHLQYHTDTRGDIRYYTKSQADLAFQPNDATLTSLAAYNANGILTQTAANTFVNRSLAVGSSKLSIANPDGVAGDPTYDINESNLSINNIGGTLSAAKGGTGQLGYTVGDVLYASTTSALSKLPSVAAGAHLRSGGVATAPVWSTLTLPNAATTGDIFQAAASNAMSTLAAVATGNALISGGVGTISSWGKIGLTTHVSGTLPIANGGTNSATALNSNRMIVSSGGAIVETAAATNGQLLIGSTGAAPVLATITQGYGSTITNGAGSITLASALTTTKTSSTTTRTTTSTTDVAIPTTPITGTPAAGTYLIMFSATIGANTTTSASTTVSLYTGATLGTATQATGTERTVRNGSGGQGASVIGSVAFQDVVTFSGTSVYEIRIRCSGGTSSIFHSQLILLRIS